MSRLQDKIILITGAARGQGAAEARLFVREGARVVITDILEPEGRQMADELGTQAVFLRHDVASEAGWQEAIAAAAALGGLHGLVNNAGIPLMQRSGGGAIVNISSVAGLRGSPGAIAYSATKWALRGMNKAAAIDLAPRNIRVNSVHPGPIDTKMLDVRTPEQNRARLQSVPMKRMGTADEVADLVLFLLSDESRYITGAEIAIDGGATL